MKIIVIEGNSLIRELLVDTLSYCVNREVKAFNNAGDLWEYLSNKGKADILFADADSPDTKGFDILSKVRLLKKKMVIVLMSGVPSSRERAMKSGADAFLAKPFEITDLFNIVQRFVVD